MPTASRRYSLILTLYAIAISPGASAGATARAQTPGEARPGLEAVRPGDTVRVWSNAPRIVGAVGLVDRLERDTLALRDLPGQRLFPTGLAVPVTALVRLDVQRGYRSSRGRGLVGALLGFVGGAVVGAFAGVALECGTSCSDQGDLAGLAGLVFGGAAGAIAGGIAGGVIGGQRRARWQPVALPGR